MDDVKHTNEQSNEVAIEVENTFDSLLTSIEHIFTELDQLTENIFAVGKHKKSVVSSIQTIAAVTEETAASAEAVSETVADEIETIKDIAILADELRSFALELEKMASIFKLNE